MVRAGVKYYRRLLPILLALVVAVALMVSVSVPAYAASYTFTESDITSFGGFISGVNSVAGSDNDDRVSRFYEYNTIPLSQSSDGFFSVGFQSNQFYYEDDSGQSVLADYYVVEVGATFDYVPNDLTTNYYNLSFNYRYRSFFDFATNADYSVFEDYSGSLIVVLDGRDKQGLRKSIVAYGDLVVSSTFYRYEFSFDFSDFSKITAITIYSALEVSEFPVSYFTFGFSPFVITPISYSDYLEYIQGQLFSILTEEQKQSGYLEQLVSLVTSGNAKLDQIISIIQTVNSSNATVAEKIEAGNQLQQIQNNLIQGDVNATTPDVIVDADVQAGDLSSAEDAIYSELGEIDFSIFDPDIMFSPVVPGFAFAGLIYKKIFDIPIVYTVTFAALILGLACAIIGRTVGRD